MPTFCNRQVLVKDFPGLSVEPSAMVTSLIKAAASQRLTEMVDSESVDVGKVNMGVPVGNTVEVGIKLIDVALAC